MAFVMKQEDDRFRWENEDLVLEFSDPSTQGYKEFVPLKSVDDILYYYYTVRIYKKVMTWEDVEGGEDEDNEQEVIVEHLVTERSTHDFPTITQLKWTLAYLVMDDPKENGQKDTYQDGSVRFRKTMSTEGFACDDFYEITKSVDEKGQDEQYVVYIGTGYAPQSDLNSTGIRTPYVTRNDIETLLQCVEAFIEYSIDQNNKALTLRKQAFRIRDQKIYEYKTLDETIDENCIENIFTIGDCVTLIVANEQDQADYRHVQLHAIEDTLITVKKDCNTHTFPIEQLAFMYQQPIKEKLTYKEEEIADDFLMVLSPEEKGEFQKEAVEKLASKYGEAIIDRTWMCLDEHAFAIEYETNDRVEAVQPIVRHVIELIKLKVEN